MELTTIIEINPTGAVRLILPGLVWEPEELHGRSLDEAKAFLANWLHQQADKLAGRIDE